MYKYTLGFLIKGNQILMLNRNKSPWMGSWNGLGGKIQINETPQACIQREVFEETGLELKVENFIFKGVVTWDEFDAMGNGLYIYIYHLNEKLDLITPLKVDEGILDFKDISWISSFENEGVAKNIPYFLPSVLNDDINYNYLCKFEDRILKEVVKKKVDVCLD
ncbi:NUDIX hydrolase [Mariniplasma anaerobium]|uniref:7,8-dihydro-8-oxoguanine triphosphatase n=1 Tax=Mariniplasma anaerobium TaxID=2735436 RepID=A0A7U9THA1_9MOLU|nr:NUDIX domain-containing protein [Mariniplasma anaerobium]BCR35806.1 7,8-dihydro-8-oxoguanine triphosphatase [Mariniplasma anaerobium]